jgi:undecaprenyl-diphosphatase
MAHRRLRQAVRGRKPRALLSGAAVSLAGYLALAVLAAEQHYFAIDYGTRAWVAIVKLEFLHLPMTLLSTLGDNAGLITLIAIGSAVLWRVNRRWALLLPVLMAGTGLLQYFAKWAAGRPRPTQAPLGFPSGHALSLVVFFGLMIYLIATASRRRRRWRVLACGVCAATVLLVAFSRLYLDVHWLSDVVGGLAAGTAYLLLAIWIVEVVFTSPPSLDARELGPSEHREQGENDSPARRLTPGRRNR